MNEFAERVAELSPEKRRLMELLLAEQGANTQSRQAAYVAPRTVVEETLASIWEQVLGLERIGVHDNFLELGGDSIQCIQVVARARQAGLRLSTNQLFERPTVADLAKVVSRVSQEESEQDVEPGLVPLTPIQCWFFEQNLVRPQHWNQAVVLEAPPGHDPALLAEAFRHVTERHDALRLRFERDEDGWRQATSADGGVSHFTFIDLSNAEAQQREEEIEREATKLQSSLNLSTGPLIKAALFNLGEGRPAYLLLAAHHLVVDGVSFRVLLEDYQTAYRQLSEGAAVRFPPKTASFRRWSCLLREQAQSEELRAELSFWSEAQQGRAQPIPRDFQDGNNTEASARAVTTVFDEEETRALLQKVPVAYRTQINELLLTALVHGASLWTESPTLLVDLEGHGREEIVEGLDLSRTVGWFTSIYPLWLSIDGAGDLLGALRLVKEQARRAPNKGIGYGMLRYLTGDAEIAGKLRALPQAEVVFNYLGQFDQVFAESPLFRPASKPSGPLYDPQGMRPHLLQIYGGVVEGRLQMNWVYSSNIHARGTVEALARRFAEAVRYFIQRSQAPEARGFAPSDFPEAELSQEELDRLLRG
jgi:non-ribosomal peptide synthase protein (TIGR01720 family)